MERGAGVSWGAQPEEGWVEARPFPLVLALPETSQWAVVAEGHWFRAEHAPTRSSIAARVWTARATASWQECWDQLRQGHPDLRATPAESLFEGAVPPPDGAPAGFHGYLHLFVAPADRETPEARGAAVHVGAGPRRCYAVVFRTRGQAADPHGARVAVRLELARERILRRLRWRGLDERLRPPRVDAFEGGH